MPAGPGIMEPARGAAVPVREVLNADSMSIFLKNGFTGGFEVSWEITLSTGRGLLSSCAVLKRGLFCGTSPYPDGLISIDALPAVSYVKYAPLQGYSIIRGFFMDIDYMLTFFTFKSLKSLQPIISYQRKTLAFYGGEQCISVKVNTF
jgi:hypothetical protein